MTLTSTSWPNPPTFTEAVITFECRFVFTLPTLPTPKSPNSNTSGQLAYLLSLSLQSCHHGWQPPMFQTCLLLNQGCFSSPCNQISLIWADLQLIQQNRHPRSRITRSNVAIPREGREILKLQQRVRVERCVRNQHPVAAATVEEK